MKKTAVLFILFVLPIVAYLFFASGVNNFGRLPILNEQIDDLTLYGSDVSLKDKITVLGFLGSDVEGKRGNAFNLNQKIYKRFSEFKDFQFVMVLPKGTEDQVELLKKDLGHLGNASKWKFAYLNEEDVSRFFNGLGTELSLDNNLGSTMVFIVDKDLALRGRTNDEDDGLKYGFDTTSVAELNNKMEDDVKIILAEYRLALKKNNAER